MSKKEDKDFSLPDLPTDAIEKLIGRSGPVEKLKKSEKKIVMVPLEGDEVELFMEAYNTSTSKAEKDFAKSIILNHLKK